MHRRRATVGVVLVALIGPPAAAGAVAVAALDHGLNPAFNPGQSTNDLALPDHVDVPWPWTPTARPWWVVFGALPICAVFVCVGSGIVWWRARSRRTTG